MVIRLIERETIFDVTVLAANDNSHTKLNGSLYEIENNTRLLVKGDELHDYCVNQLPGLKLSIVFFRGAKMFSFYGKLERTLIKHGERLTEISATTEIEEKNRRSAHRFQLATAVKLYVQTDGNTAELICNGQTHDISFNAICFLTNDEIIVADNSKFYVEFVLFSSHSFSLPAKLIRKGASSQSVQYKYDYAFSFDFSDNPKEKDRLITTFLKDCIGNRK